MDNFNEYFNEAVLKSPKQTGPSTAAKFALKSSKNKPQGKYGGIFVPKETQPAPVKQQQQTTTTAGLTPPKATNKGAAGRFNIGSSATSAQGKYGGIQTPKEPEAIPSQTAPKDQKGLKGTPETKLSEISKDGIKADPSRKQKERNIEDKDLINTYNKVLDIISNNYLNKTSDKLDENILKQKIFFLYALADDRAVVNTKEYSKTQPQKRRIISRNMPQRRSRSKSSKSNKSDDLRKELTAYKAKLDALEAERNKTKETKNG